MNAEARVTRSSGGKIYRLAAVSGLITGVSADGVLFAFRNPAASGKALHFVDLRAKVRTVAGFTAAQEFAAAAHWVSSFDDASYTGGTDLSDPASNPAYVLEDQVLDASTSYTTPRSKSVLVAGNVRIADTGALSHGGSPVIRSQPFAWDAYAELAAAATVHKGRAELVYAPAGSQPVGEDAGFIIKAPIALGAGGTARLFVEVRWFER
jgi:hypothetical protein